MSKKIIRFLETKRFEFVRKLGEGSFGAVCEMIHPNQERVAMKIVYFSSASDNEILMWPGLKHPKVLELLDTYRIPHLKAWAFTMPVLETTLFQTTLSEEFRRHPDAISRLRKFFRDILSGLKYLHDQELAHMDLKSNNVLIRNQTDAVLCDFSFICPTTAPVQCWGSPAHMLPPEGCRHLGPDMTVDGHPYDMWTVGFMALNVFTAHFPIRTMKRDPHSWNVDSYPELYGILKKPNMKQKIKNAFPGSEISKVDMKQMRNFIHMFLHVSPSNRPSANRALTHAFLKIGNYISKVDISWKKRVSGLLIRQLILDFHRRLTDREVREDDRFSGTSTSDVSICLELDDEGGEISDAVGVLPVDELKTNVSSEEGGETDYEEVGEINIVGNEIVIPESGSFICLEENPVIQTENSCANDLTQSEFKQSAESEDDTLNNEQENPTVEVCRLQSSVANVEKVISSEEIKIIEKVEASFVMKERLESKQRSSEYPMEDILSCGKCQASSVAEDTTEHEYQFDSISLDGTESQKRRYLEECEESEWIPKEVIPFVAPKKKRFKRLRLILRRLQARVVYWKDNVLTSRRRTP